MQQNSELIEWAKERAEEVNSIDTEYWIRKVLLPKLEGYKTSPNSQSTPCQHKHGTRTIEIEVCNDCCAEIKP